MGYNFFTKKGKFYFKTKNEEIFLDLKLNDIPNIQLIKIIKDLKRISYITAHCGGGLEILKSIKKQLKK